CQSGTTYEASTQTCIISPPDGTLIASANLQPVYSGISYQATTDAGMMLTPVGTFTTPTAGPAHATPLWMPQGANGIAARPVGGGLVKVKYLTGSIADAPTTIDVNKQFTLGEYKNCQGTVRFYRPPTGTKLRMIADLAGCLPDLLYTA